MSMNRKGVTIILLNNGQKGNLRELTNRWLQRQMSLPIYLICLFWIVGTPSLFDSKSWMLHC